ncbi:MAG TPA: DUF1801 domain-containing protein [Longimicrobiaceae bacterium]|nr:DUF1801 domain-containing protein [Longimicrobiaceae bacterium]
MRTAQPAPRNVDEYIAGFPAGTQEVLRQVRATIRAAAPDAEEAISYQIPTFKLRGRQLIYFAGFKQHVSMYPAPVRNPEFAEEMAVYGSGAGTAKFPLSKPIPFDLITRIVRFRIDETLRLLEAKGKKKPRRAS